MTRVSDAEQEKGPLDDVDDAAGMDDDLLDAVDGGDHAVEISVVTIDGQVGQPEEVEPADGEVAYECATWAGESRELLASLLGTKEIVHAWQGTTLTVREEDEERVDALIDEVLASAHPALDPAADKLAYEVGTWPASLQTSLAEALTAANLPYEWDEQGDLVIYAEHEEQVEAILDDLPDPEDDETRHWRRPRVARAVGSVVHRQRTSREASRRFGGHRGGGRGCRWTRADVAPVRVRSTSVARPGRTSGRASSGDRSRPGRSRGPRRRGVRRAGRRGPGPGPPVRLSASHPGGILGGAAPRVP